MMKCYEIDLSKMLKVTMLNRTEIAPPTRHITRCIKEYIVYVIKSGCLKLLQNGEMLELFPGDVCIFTPGEVQEPFEETECTFYFLHFLSDGFSKCEITDEEYCHAIKKQKADFVKANIYGSDSYDYIKVLIKRKFNIADEARLEQLISLFKSNVVSYENNTPEWRLNVSFGAMSILMRLENICFDITDKGYHGKNGKVYDTAERVADYIRKHYNENFGSYDIEKSLLINFDYANRIFKKHFGYSIIKYRNFLRINTAKTLIFEHTLDEVAAKVGFFDRYYLSRCFKKFEGMSPNEYKERMRIKNGYYKE